MVNLIFQSSKIADMNDILFQGLISAKFRFPTCFFLGHVQVIYPLAIVLKLLLQPRQHQCCTVMVLSIPWYACRGQKLAYNASQRPKAEFAVGGDVGSRKS